MTEKHYLDDGSTIDGQKLDNLGNIINYEITDAEERFYFFSEVEKEMLSLLREDRNRKLAATDYIVIKSLESGKTVPLEWQNYRQALRDITKYYKSQDEVQWPALPLD